MDQRAERESKSKDQQKVAPIIIFILGLSIFLLYGPLSSTEAIVDRIVAVVNQEIITLSEVEKLMGSFKEESQAGDRLERRERFHEACRTVLERLIEEKLIDQEVKKAGVKVTSKEVEAAVEEVRRQNALNQEELEKALAKDGLTLEAFKKEIEKRLQRIKLINWAVKVETKAEEKELRDFYEKNIDQYRVNETCRPGQIVFLVSQNATPEEIREIRKKCEKVLDKIKRGEDFGEMAILYSEHLSRKDRGDMGYFKKGELLPAFERELFRLQVGEVSGIIRTNIGFHIVKLLDRKGGTSLPFEEVKEKVRVDYNEKKREKAFQQFLSTLKAKAIIEIKL